MNKLPRAGLFTAIRRRLSGSVNDASSGSKTETERRLESLLAKRFQSTPDTTTAATSIAVTDISSGCGAMFNVRVQSPLFSGLTKVEQHKMVTESLREEIKSMHGLVIETKLSK